MNKGWLEANEVIKLKLKDIGDFFIGQRCKEGTLKGGH